jgi:hypothetical protein
MRILAPAAFLLALHAPCALAACATSSEPWRGVLYDIDQKITLEEGPSGGSTYVPFADGAGVHLYADANLVAEADDNSFSSHTAVHEYIHLLQQAMLAGEITNTTVGPVPLKATSTSADRFKCINKCGVPAVFCEKSLEVLEALPDTMKLLDRTTYVIWYPHSEDGNEPCTDTDAKKVEILEEVYGSTCANGKVITPDFMRNENHLVAEGDAEYWALKLVDDTNVFSLFDGAAYWEGKIRDGKEGCSIPGDAKFDVKSGSGAHVDAVIEAYEDAGAPRCADNPIGEIAYQFFLDWCVDNNIACTQAEQFNVWTQARILGWCGAFEATYGKTWGEYVCAMEAADAYDVDTGCVAADVPCIACSGAGCVGATSEDSDDDAAPPATTTSDAAPGARRRGAAAVAIAAAAAAAWW